MELSLLLGDVSLREISGIDSSDSASNGNVEEEALKLAHNFTGNKVELAAVTIDKTNAFLGATVKNVDARVVISRIVAGGAVERDGRLQEGKIAVQERDAYLCHTNISSQSAIVFDP